MPCALCLVFSDYEALYALRVIAGTGSGLITAVAVATLGGTTNPVMAFNLELVGFSFSSAFELRFLPTLTMDGIYFFFMSLSVACVLLVFWIPARPLNAEQLALQENKQQKDENWHVPKIIPMLCLTAICFTYINIGGYFTYIELAALAEGISQDWTGVVLAWGSFLAIAGCVLAVLCQRYGLFRPLFISLIVMAATAVMPSVGITDYSLLVSVFIFMALWTFVDVYQAPCSCGYGIALLNHQCHGILLEIIGKVPFLSAYHCSPRICFFTVYTRCPLLVDHNKQPTFPPRAKESSGSLYSEDHHLYLSTAHHI